MFSERMFRLQGACTSSICLEQNHLFKTRHSTVIMTRLWTPFGWFCLLGLRRCKAVLHYEQTPNGFTSPPKGWNSFALQAVGQFEFNQDNVIAQCDAMHMALGVQGYKYCSLDSGWSVGDHGDDYGRILYDIDHGWDIPALSSQFAR